MMPMRSSPTVNTDGAFFSPPARLILLAITAGVLAIQRAEAGNIAVWDTGSHAASLTDAENRTGWKAVPADLFALEAEPLKAASDPGYYGLEYAFKGDAVVENHSLTAIFSSALGRVAIYSKTAGQENAGLGRKVMEFAPLQGKSGPAKISRCEILHNGGDEVAMEVSFAAQGAADEVSAVLSFGKDEIVEIKPSAKM